MNFPFGDRCRGAARLSSARVVRCWVKSRNERNPCPVLLILRNALSGDRQRQVGGRWGRRQVIVAFMSGLRTCYNGRYKALQTREGEPIAKNRPQFGLQAATRLHEAGIASNGVSE